jgi:hypothetical protein
MSFCQGERVIHEIAVTVRPFPSWDRIRVAWLCLVYGQFTFSGEIALDAVLDGETV